MFLKYSQGSLLSLESFSTKKWLKCHTRETMGQQTAPLSSLPNTVLCNYDLYFIILYFLASHLIRFVCCLIYVLTELSQCLHGRSSVNKASKVFYLRIECLFSFSDMISDMKKGGLFHFLDHQQTHLCFFMQHVKCSLLL